jgi:hypothetical protein
MAGGWSPPNAGRSIRCRRESVRAEPAQEVLPAQARSLQDSDASSIVGAIHCSAPDSGRLDYSLTPAEIKYALSISAPNVRATAARQ